MRYFISILVLSWVALWPAVSNGQFIEEEGTGGARFGEEQTHRYQLGVRVTASGGACRNILATIPVPQDWPEQSVRILSEDTSPHVKRVRERTLNGSVTQMVIEIPQLGKGREAHALRVYEIRRRAIMAPKETATFRIPTKVDRPLKPYLGTSPYIESRHGKIRSLSKQILTETAEASDWEKVEAIYDQVRERVVYQDGPLKGALQALRDGHGDCEELSSLFIAICRAGKIPARTVWVPDHCYAEFYLEDSQGDGHWFPCQPAGSRAFGEMLEPRPILQKGDNFRVPEKPRKNLRYVAEFLSGVPVGGGKPTVEWIRRVLE